MSLNKETGERYMESLWSKWDHEAVLACLTDDIEWVVPGAFHLTGIERHSTARFRARALTMPKSSS